MFYVMILCNNNLGGAEHNLLRLRESNKTRLKDTTHVFALLLLQPIYNLFISPLSCLLSRNTKQKHNVQSAKCVSASSSLWPDNESLLASSQARRSRVSRALLLFPGMLAPKQRHRYNRRAPARVIRLGLLSFVLARRFLIITKMPSCLCSSPITSITNEPIVVAFLLFHTMMGGIAGNKQGHDAVGLWSRTRFRLPAEPTPVSPRTPRIERLKTAWGSTTGTELSSSSFGPHSFQKKIFFFPCLTPRLRSELMPLEKICGSQSSRHSVFARRAPFF